MIRCHNLSKKYAGMYALKEVDVHIQRGGITVIMGGSGSGKTTLLRMMSALVPPSSGQVMFKGEDLTSVSRKRLYELRESMGMVFQYSALLNSMNVYDNLAFPLHEHTDLPEEVISTILQIKLEQVGLRGMEHLMPSELSGGMAKRVALARSVVMDPELVFFDEPTSGLDPISAGVITTLIHDITRKTNMTSIVVTHDVEAGLGIADHVILLWQGQVIATGTAEDIRHSTDERVRQFIEGRPDGPIPFSRSTTPYAEELFGNNNTGMRGAA
ncbi:MAG: ABC transporter ATP-binding protein [Mariprofundales bacterium]